MLLFGKSFHAHPRAVAPMSGIANIHRNAKSSDDNRRPDHFRSQCGDELIVRRDTGESYMAYLKRLAEAEGIDVQDAAALLRMDRKRKKKTSNEDWLNPSDQEAEITKLKGGRTALAFKAENA